MTATAALTLQQRDAIVQRVNNLVVTKVLHPGFNAQTWNNQNDRLLAAREIDDPFDFRHHVDGLIKSLHLSDATFVHQSERPSIPKGVAARYQYCTPKECNPAYTQASAAGDVFYAELRSNVGWVKITKFPGAVGIDMARQITKAIEEVGKSGRLIIDLRGNAGGGLSFLRVMSLLTPGRVPVGYSVTRKRFDRGYTKESLRQFNWIPKSKIGLYSLVVKFAAGDDSVSVITEGLGAKPWHRRTVLLVDQYTTGAGERIAAFAQENKLAPVIGSKTAGRLICCSWYDAGFEHFLRLPARLWLTWTDRQLEELGINPDVSVPMECRDERSDYDAQLEKAIETVSSL